MEQIEYSFNEESLINALRKGEARAYEYIYRESWPSILSLVHLNSGQEDDAKDLLQEAIIVLFKELQKQDFKLKCKVTTYLYSVCRNKWLNTLRHKRLLMNILDPIDIIDINEFINVIDIPYNMEQDELEKSLRKAIKNLESLCKTILIQFYFYKKTLNNIALFVNTPPEVVKVRKFRCMQKLKDILEQKYGFR